MTRRIGIDMNINEHGAKPYLIFNPLEISTPKLWARGNVVINCRLKGLKHLIIPSAQPTKIKFSPQTTQLALEV